MGRTLTPRALQATALAGLIVLLAAGAAARSDRISEEVSFARIMGLLAVASAAYLATQIDIAWTFSLAIALSVFSGQSDQLGFPIGPDRLAMAFGVVLLLWRIRDGTLTTAAPSQPMLWLLAVVAVYGVTSAAIAGTLTDHDGLYGLLDRLGLVPFAMFLLAPTVFATERQRMILLAVLVVLGGYLGVTAFAEELNADGLVFPSYILDPSVGIHADRARGPFVEAVAMGLALLACGIAACVALARWRDAIARAAALAVVILCAGGIIFTLTRAVWIAAIVAPLVALLCSSATRRWVMPAAIVAALAVGGTLAAAPDLRERADSRTQDEKPVWDRLNTDAAALRMIEARPLQGFGWNSFVERSPDYMRQADGYPLTGEGLVVHNVFLSHAAELGLIGAALWFTALAVAVGSAILRRAGPLLEPWRLGLIALALSWVIVANFGPLGYAFPTLLLWTWAGVLSVRQPGS